MEPLEEIIQGDESLLQLLDVAGKRSKNIHRVDYMDINRICDKITAISTLDPEKQTPRQVWHSTGKLLLGLLKCFNSQTNNVFDDSRLLHQNCINFSFNTSSSLKRKGDTKSHDESKRKSTFELTSLWEEPLELDHNQNAMADKCLVPEEHITLNDSINAFADVPLIDEVEDFGDESLNSPFDDVSNEELPEENASFLSPMPNMPIEMDNDVDMDIDMPPPTQEPTSLVRSQRKPKIIYLSPLKLMPVKMKGKEKKKMRSSLQIDTEISIGLDEIAKRVSNLSFGCKVRASIKLECLKVQQKKFENTMNDMFTMPVMKSSINRELFARCAKIKQIETDWTIVRDYFDCDNHEELNETHYQTRYQKKFRQQSNAFTTSTPIEWDSVLPPSSQFQDDIDASNAEDIFDMPFSPPAHFRNANPNQNITEPNEGLAHPKIITLLGEDTFASGILTKLRGLWISDQSTIAVDTLFVPDTNRIRAAKMFYSLLVLKQKKLVQLENGNDGKISRISEGEEYISIKDQID